MKNALSDILGVSEEFISVTFIEGHMEDILLAAENDADAINRLAIAASEDILVNFILNGEAVPEDVQTLHNELTTLIPDIEVGVSLKDEEFFEKAKQIIAAANMTATEATEYFRSMGFETKIKTT
jgi:hypothetical protein